MNPFFGRKNINRAKLPASHITVAPGDKSIYVTEVHAKSVGSAGMMLPEGTFVHRYSSDGGELASRQIADSDEDTTADYHAITAMDAVVYNGKKYVAVGLNQYGVRILDGDTLQLVTTVYANWDGDGLWQGDTVSDVKLWTDDSGRLLVAAAKFTYNDNALNVANALTGEPIWANVYRTSSDPWLVVKDLQLGRYPKSGELVLSAPWSWYDGLRLKWVSGFSTFQATDGTPVEPGVTAP
jgi:hypothetical protein